MASIVSNSKGISQGAFSSSKLQCPYCKGTRWKFIENIGKFRIRYQCKDCHHTTQYDYAMNMGHPYKVFGKGVFRRLLERIQGGARHRDLLTDLSSGKLR